MYYCNTVHYVKLILYIIVRIVLYTYIMTYCTRGTDCNVRTVHIYVRVHVLHVASLIARNLGTGNIIFLAQGTYSVGRLYSGR